MSQLFHYLAIGTKGGKEHVESLYLGFDGAAGQAAYEAVIAKPDHGFTRIKRIVNFDGAPLPITSAKMVGTTPVFRNTAVDVSVKIAEAPEGIAKAELDELTKRNALVDAQFKNRFGTDAVVSVAKDEPVTNAGELKTDGPTMEEWLKAGYKPEHYPPQGYAEKPSAGLDEYRKSLKSSQTQTEPAKDSTPVEGSGEPAAKPASGKTADTKEHTAKKSGK